jgi:peroxiredoxin
VDRPAEGEPACGSGKVGQEVGDVAGNFVLQDQHGNSVWLSDYCDKTVFIEGAAMWCPFCRQMAEDMSELYPKYKDRGLVFLTLLGENNEFGSGIAPTTAELNEWADTFDLDTPVMADPGDKVFKQLWFWGGVPHGMLLTPGAVIKIDDGEVVDVEHHFDP